MYQSVWYEHHSFKQLAMFYSHSKVTGEHKPYLCLRMRKSKSQM